MKAELSEMEFLHDGDPFVLAEDIPDLDFYFAQVWNRAFVKDMRNSVGINYRKVLSIFNGMRIRFHYGEKDTEKFSKHVFGKVEKDPKFGDRINEEIKKRSDKLVEHTLHFWGKDPAKMGNGVLWKHLSESDALHHHLYEYGWLSNVTDMFFPLFTTKLREYLKTKCNSEEEISAHFVTLTSPEEETVAMKETKSFLRIAVKIQNDEYHLKLFAKGEKLQENAKGEIKRLIEAHWKEFVHLKFMYHGTTERMDALPYYEQLSSFIQENRNAAEERVKLDEEFKAKILEKEKLFEKLKINPHYRHLFRIFSEFMVTKWYRRNAQILTWYRLDPIFQEIGKRNGLAANQVRFMLPEEIEEMLHDGKVDRKEILKRTEYCALYVEEGKECVCTGKEAEKLEELVKTEAHGDVSELKGQCACLGKAKGRVKIIQGAKDMHKFHKGDVLVAYATDPDVVPAMKKAAAIVTDQGGVTCHAAIVSRELNVPCVIGTKIATKVFHDGEMVEVDATKGIVRKMKA